MSETRFIPQKEPAEAALNGRKLLSICIPTLNRARYLPETIESLATQMSSDVELLVYDTGSSDGTVDVMSKLCQQFPVIRFFHVDRKLGFDETALLLLEQCRGDYVWFFGSDDLLKKDAIETVRQSIEQALIAPSFIFLNHEIISDSGELLITSNVGRLKDRQFSDGRQCVAWLGLNLGYISACIFRRDESFDTRQAAKFIGSLWMGLHLNLLSISKRGAALYLGRPLVSARRNPANVYNYGEVFCKSASRVFWEARAHGIGWLPIYRGLNKTVRTIYLRFCLSWRSDDPAQLSHTFPVMLRTSWMFPWFWLLIVPIRLTPTRFARGIRNYLRAWRRGRNEERLRKHVDAGRAPNCATSDVAYVLRRPFRGLLFARKLIATSGADAIFRATPFLVSGYRTIYALLRPKETIAIDFRGHRLYLDLTDTVVARSLLTSGEWEQYETRVFTAALQEGMVVVDVGANIGHYTLEAARAVGETGQVHAFEPEPRNFGLLCQNIEANRYRNVAPVRKALSNHSGAARLALSPDNFGAHHLEDSTAIGDSIEVETLTLDEHFGGRPEKIDVIKMDAEGAEMAIFDGMKGLLNANRDLILFTEFWPGAIQASGSDPKRFIESIIASGFEVGIVDQAKTRIEALRTGDLETFVNSLLREDHGKFYVDLLCVRGKAIHGPVGPHEWWHSPEYVTAAVAEPA